MDQYIGILRQKCISETLLGELHIQADDAVVLVSYLLINATPWYRPFETIARINPVLEAEMQHRCPYCLKLAMFFSLRGNLLPQKQAAKWNAKSP